MSKDGDWNIATVTVVPYEGHDPEGVTNLFLQWKGTDACFDFYCECGAQSHFDGYFAYSIKCPKCGAIFEMPYTIFPVKVAESSHNPVVPEMDAEDEDAVARSLVEPTPEET